MHISDVESSRWFEIKQVAFAWIGAIARVGRPSAVPIGLGVTLLLVCERFRLDPRRVLQASERALRRARDLEPQYPRAISQYLQKELSDGAA